MLLENFACCSVSSKLNLSEFLETMIKCFIHYCCSLIILFACFGPSLQSVNLHWEEKDSILFSAHEKSFTEEKSSSVVSEKPIIFHEDCSTENYEKTYSRSEAALLAFISACLVGFSGVVPLLILPSFVHSGLQDKSKFSFLYTWKSLQLPVHETCCKTLPWVRV